MWVIPLLDTDHYCGVEPNREMLNKGLERFVDPAILALKKPRFDNNDRFDMSVFGERFTHVILRSIWSHTAKSQMELSLDSFCEVAAPGAVMVASYNPVVPGTSDYKGTEWEKGTVHHSFRWIRSVCKSRGLTVRPLARQPVNRGCESSRSEPAIRARRSSCEACTRCELVLSPPHDCDDPLSTAPVPEGWPERRACERSVSLSVP
jgi:hypothetical protein